MNDVLRYRITARTDNADLGPSISYVRTLDDVREAVAGFVEVEVFDLERNRPVYFDELFDALTDGE